MYYTVEKASLENDGAFSIYHDNKRKCEDNLWQYEDDVLGETGTIFIDNHERIYFCGCD